ncbi:hypothetical protein [Pseudoalteromonas aliena]|uniref:hypothetical protein n=1 Tax=Pseudoalteromonas aliena TaxID=247523 RepID=UPI0024948A3F|nr:hypothetical protein [Pseudoalteromonas aliena]
MKLSRYIVLNPIRANMVDSLSQWPWSSWHYVMREREAPVWLDVDKILLQFTKYIAWLPNANTPYLSHKAKGLILGC